MGSIHMQPNSDVLKLARKRKKQEADKPTLLTISEACDCLRVSRHTIYRLFNTHELAYVPILTRRFIELDAIKEYLARKTVGTI